MSRLSLPPTPTGMAQHVAVTAICSAPSDTTASHSHHPLITCHMQPGDGTAVSRDWKQNTGRLISCSAAKIWPCADNTVPSEEGKVQNEHKNAVCNKERELCLSSSTIKDIVATFCKEKNMLHHRENSWVLQEFMAGGVKNHFCHSVLLLSLTIYGI